MELYRRASVISSASIVDDPFVKKAVIRQNWEQHHRMGYRLAYETWYENDAVFAVLDQIEELNQLPQNIKYVHWIVLKD